MSSQIHIVGVAGITCSAIVISFVILNPSVQGSYTNLASAASQTAQADPGLPVRLTIPIINVNAVIEYVGLTSAGLMGVPKGPNNVAWYDPGPRPGEIGSAVIDGHSGWKDAIPAVFDNLYKLRTGDKIYIENEKGVTTTFVVREIRTYDPKADASEVFGSSDGKAHLNLITCEGVWDPVSKSSSRRLVIFTDKE